MILVWLLFCFGSTLFPQSTFDSKFFFYIVNETSGKDYIVDDKNLTIGGIGVTFDYKYKNYLVKGTFSNNRFYNSSFSNYNDYQRITYIGNRTEHSFDFDNSKATLDYKNNFFSYSIGKSNYKIGDGYRSIIFSDSTPSFPNFNFTWNFYRNLDFSYMHGILSSSIYDERTNEELYSSFNKDQYDRHVVYHKINYRIDWIKDLDLSIGFSEMVAYGARGFDFNYIFPFNFYWSIQHSLGDKDNVQMHGYINLKIKDISFFYNLLIDEWTPELTFEEINRNWFGHHGGIKLNEVFFHDRLIIEVIWNDHRIYRHRFQINDFYSYNNPIGFWAGPHSQELFIMYEANLSETNSICFRYTNSSRGELTKEMILDQYRTIEYKRFSGIVESKEMITFELEKQFYENIKIKMGVSLVNWTNAGFEPYQNSDNIYDKSELIDIEKISFNTSVFYNF